MSCLFQHKYHRAPDDHWVCTKCGYVTSKQNNQDKMMECRFRHKFEARYNYIEEKRFPNKFEAAINFKLPDKPLLRDPITNKFYLYDICVKCGKIVKQDEKNY